MTSSSGVQKPIAFEAAVREWLQKLPKKSNKRKVLATCISSKPCPTPREVEEAISTLEQSFFEKPATRRIRRVLAPVITVLNDYTGILDSLAQADPMPSALIWGSLKAVVQCSNRYLGLYDTIRDQLGRLTQYLNRLSLYDDLFGDSTVMQEVLKASYFNVLRFWSRVEKECNHCVVSAIFRSAASFSTSKLDKILEQICQDADDLDKLIPIVQGRLDRGERENASEERRLAGLARAEVLAFIHEQREDKLQRDLDRKSKSNRHHLHRFCAHYGHAGSRQNEVRTWIHANNQSNIRHQARNTTHRTAGTADWLLKIPKFQTWLRPASKEPLLWLHAAPGMGKSVLTAHIVEHIKTVITTSAVVFHYYRFDEQYDALETYRIIADQLFDQLWRHREDVPDSLHAHIQSSNADPKIVRNLIEILIRLASFPVVYIFLDGLDEECHQRMKWAEALQVMQWLQNLALQNPTSVRIWYSSQDKHCIRKELGDCPAINVTEDCTGDDIRTYISEAFPALELGDTDPGYQNMVLHDIGIRAQGNFLWAHLMILSLERATNLEDIMLRIVDGLPLDLNDYYERLFNRIDKDDRVLAW
ncbi:MAG: hypothetical protein Q9190_000811 [Brigantiaea leucoxantha]